MTRAALYARYSSDQQRDASIADQLRVCRAYAERQGWQIAEEYTDHAVSGATLLRPGIQALISDAARGRFDVVLSEALDRLSRDQEDVAGLYKRLVFADVKIVTVSEGEIGNLHVGLKGTMNMIALQDLALKTRRGLEGRVRAGRSGGGLCYGYDVVRQFDTNGEPVRGGRSINTAEAATVRRVFEEYALGKSPRQIAYDLNRDQIGGPNGGDWGQSTINGNAARGTGLLNNELYIGRLVWNRLRYVKDPDTGKRVSRANPDDALVTEDVPHLRIVPQELWDRVKARQALVTKKSPATRAGKEHRFWEHQRPRHLFSGLMRCGACGGGYSKISSNLFGCSTARNKNTCDNRLNIRMEKIEAVVLEGLRAHLMDPDLFREFADEFVKETNRLLSYENAKLTTARATLARVDARLKKLVNAIADGAAWRPLKEEMDELQARQDVLRTFLAAPAPVAPRLHPNLPDLYRRKVADLQQAVRNDETRAEAFELIRSLVEEIRLIPVDGVLTIELRGDLAGILSLCAANKKAASVEAALVSQVKLVAGAGFEPAAFRL